MTELEEVISNLLKKQKKTKKKKNKKTPKHNNMLYIERKRTLG